MDQRDQRELGCTVVARRLQKCCFNFLSVERFVLIKFRGGQGIAVPDIVDVGDLARSRFLVPYKKFLRLYGSLGDKKCFSAICGSKSRRVDRNCRGDLLDGAIRAELTEFSMKAIRSDSK